MADFLQDEGFRNWVQGDRAQEAFWISFLEKYPEKAVPFRQAEQIIRAIGVAGEVISSKEIRAETGKFIETAGEYPAFSEREFAESDLRRSGWSRWAFGIAAVIVLVAGLKWIGYGPPVDPVPATQEKAVLLKLVRTCNDSEKVLRIVLGDESEVMLSPNSCLQYPSQFSDTARRVYLSGEAAFTVTRQGQPFMVYSGDVITRVLGTRFVVRAFEGDKKITVQVQTGKVSVYKATPDTGSANKEVKGLVITANQAAIFEKELSQLSKTLVTDPMRLIADVPDELFKYDEVPLPVILNEMQKLYGIPIQYDSELFRNCKITATLSDEKMYEKLDILCKAVGANYEIVDGQILVDGKGCNSAHEAIRLK